MSFSKFKLWPHQIAAHDESLEIFKDDKFCRLLIVQPTGTGKTLTIANIITSPEIINTLKRDNTRPFRVVYRAHVNRLLTQARRLCVTHEKVRVIKSQDEWLTQNPNHTPDNIEIVFMSIGQKMNTLDFDLVVLDEAHHEACDTSQMFFEVAGKFPMIGLTATPDRSDGLMIKFNRFIMPISRKDAVKAGFVCEASVRTIVDTTSNKNKIDLFNEIFSKYINEFGQTIVFMRTLKEVKIVTDYINSLGKSAVAITNQSVDEIDTILDDFGLGKYQFVVNARKLGEGVDVAGVTDVFLGKAVGSYTDLNQYIGRASRVDVDRCVVWEFINPLSSNNLDSTFIVGKPKEHKIIYKKDNEWLEITK